MKTNLIKIMTPQTILISALLAGSVLINTLAQADTKAETNIEIPTTATAIWLSIDKQTAELAAVIQAGKLEQVHHHAFAIRDLAAALPQHSGALPADKLANVKTYSQFVATLAERLDASGDAEEKAGTESNFQKLKEVLKALRENYSSAK